MVYRMSDEKSVFQKNYPSLLSLYYKIMIFFIYFLIFFSELTQTEAQDDHSPASGGQLVYASSGQQYRASKSGHSCFSGWSRLLQTYRNHLGIEIVNHYLTLGLQDASIRMHFLIFEDSRAFGYSISLIRDWVVNSMLMSETLIFQKF